MYPQYVIIIEAIVLVFGFARYVTSYGNNLNITYQCYRLFLGRAAIFNIDNYKKNQEELIKSADGKYEVAYCELISLSATK